MGSWRIALVLLVATVAGLASAQYDHTANTNWAIHFGSGVVDQDVDTELASSAFDPATGDFFLAGEFDGEKEKSAPRLVDLNFTSHNHLCTYRRE